jgi:hypothetical protein
MVKRGWTLLKAVVDLGDIQMVLACRHAEWKSYGIVEPSTKISKEGQVGIPAGSPWEDNVGSCGGQA